MRDSPEILASRTLMPLTACLRCNRLAKPGIPWPAARLRATHQHFSMAVAERFGRADATLAALNNLALISEKRYLFMKRLSLFDLPAGPGQVQDTPSMWWVVKYKAMHRQAVTDFTQVYAVEPIFHLSWPRHQVFLSDPSHALIIDRATGSLDASGRRTLWNVDYREAKAFRPNDLAPQIPAVLSGETPLEAWKPMVMSDMVVPESDLDAFLSRLASEDAFALHWPVFEGKYAFRIFCPPALLDALRYRQAVMLPAAFPER